MQIFLLPSVCLCRCRCRCLWPLLMALALGSSCSAFALGLCFLLSTFWFLVSGPGSRSAGSFDEYELSAAVAACSYLQLVSFPSESRQSRQYPSPPFRLSCPPTVMYMSHFKVAVKAGKVRKPMESGAPFMAGNKSLAHCHRFVVISGAIWHYDCQLKNFP